MFALSSIKDKICFHFHFRSNIKERLRVNQALLYLPCFVPRPGATWRPPRFVSAATVASAREGVALFPPSVSDAPGHRSVKRQRSGSFIDYQLDPILCVQLFVLFWNLKYKFYLFWDRAYRRVEHLLTLNENESWFDNLREII